MIHASQKALFQHQNKKVLDIRQSELDYYTRFYSSLVTQVAIILGSILTTIAELKNLDTSQDKIVSEVYYVFACITFGVGVHCMMTSTCMIVFAPNLALNGPIGSMTKAVAGMSAERDQIFSSFLVCMVSWSINQVLLFWIVTTNVVSIITTILTIYFSSVWYSYSLSIYNRFKIHDFLKYGPASLALKEEDINFNKNISNESSNPIMQLSSTISRNLSTKTNLNKTNLSKSIDDFYKNDNKNDNDFYKNDIVTGYLSYAIMSSSTTQVYQHFRRKFFCVNYETKTLTYYTSEQNYKDNDNPESPRPIDLSEYRLATIDESCIPFRILLKEIGIRGSLEFLCDTFEDLLKWSDAFRYLCLSVRDSDDVSTIRGTEYKRDDPKKFLKDDIA